MDDMQTVEITKRPGQSLGFYIREGNGRDRLDGVFISRLAVGGVADLNGLLHVGDEIISVNTLPVAGRRLEDVVISMSVARRLVLTIRPSTAAAAAAFCSETNSSSSLSALAADDDNNVSSAPNPVVVLRGGYKTQVQGQVPTFNNSYHYPGNINDQALDTGERPGHWNSHDTNAAMLGHGQITWSNADTKRLQQLSVSTFQPTAPGLASMTNTATLRTQHPGYFSDSEAEYSPSAHHPPPRHMSTLNRTSVGLRHQAPRRYDMDMVDRFLVNGDDFMDAAGRPYRQQPPTASGPHYCMPFTTGTNNNILSGGGGGGGTNLIPTGAGFNGLRLSGLPGADEIDAVLQDNRRLSSKDRYLAQMLMPANNGGPPVDRYSTLPVQRSSSSNSTNRYSTGGLINPLLAPVNIPVPGVQSSTTQRNSLKTVAYNRNFTQRQTDKASGKFSTQLGFYGNDDSLWNGGSRPGGNRPRLTRKMSADCLLDYCTYQLNDGTNDDVISSEKPATVMTSRVGQSSAAHRSPSLHFPTSASLSTAAPTTTSSTSGGRGSPTPAVTNETTSNHASITQTTDLTKAPLQLRTDLFRPYPAAVTHTSATSSKSAAPFDGLLSVHVYSGRGLVQSTVRSVFQELYCVAAVDGVCRARTAVQSGSTNFDWDDKFIVDIFQASTLTFGIYTYDGRGGRHRLCFTGSVVLPTVLKRNSTTSSESNNTENSPQRLAVRLDPRGLLYVEMMYRDPVEVFRRSPSVDVCSMFGVGLGATASRNRQASGNTAATNNAAVTVEVPNIVRQCVNEVERRGGIKQVGIYQLCGSAKRATRLRHDLDERRSKTTPVNLLLSSVGDINVITVILKDYLRELPDPLCTSSLYQMLMDALSVQVAGDSQGNAQLMLSILDCLPRINQLTLAFILDHLKKICINSSVNEMTSLNLATLFGPILVCPSTQTDRNRRVTVNLDQHIQLIKYLVDIWPEQRDPSLPLAHLVSSEASEIVTSPTS